MTSTAPNSQSRLNSIDALRGLAALTIVFYHARPMFWVGLDQTWKQYGLRPDINAWLGYATAIFYFGGVAVDLFFVLSGYCIHRRGAQQLATNPKAELELKQYAIRRIWRIYPTYVAALCITALVDAYIRNNYPAEIMPGQDNSIFAFAISLLGLPGLAAPYFGSNSVLWTLALEMQFYAIYPILFYVSRRYGSVKILAFSCCISLIYIGAGLLFDLSNLFPYRGSGSPIFLPYLFTWTFGFYLAEVEAGRAVLPKKFWLIASLVISLAVPSYLFNMRDLAIFSWALLSGVLLYWSVSPSGNNFWSNNFLVRFLPGIGLFSYSLYAIHRPALLFLKVSLFPGSGRCTTLITALIASLVAVIVGWLFFVIIEKRTLKPIVWTK
jgi:peptidoglycan/LPS O-acetylase OafA/YrhL